MSVNAFLKGVSIGIIAGAAIGISMAPANNRRKFMKSGAGKALRNFGSVIENISDVMGG